MSDLVMWCLLLMPIKKDEKIVLLSKLNFGLSLTDVLVGPSNVHNGRHFNIS